MGNQCRGDFADETSPHFDRIREVGIERDFLAKRFSSPSDLKRRPLSALVRA